MNKIKFLSKLKSIGFKPKINLKDGLIKTY